MTPMRTLELPPESMYWNAFNEADSLAIIMRAQNYINNELIRKFFHSRISWMQEQENPYY